MESVLAVKKKTEGRPRIIFTKQGCKDVSIEIFEAHEMIHDRTGDMESQLVKAMIILYSRVASKGFLTKS